MIQTLCPICGISATESCSNLATNRLDINCPRCGSFSIGRAWADRLRTGEKLTEAQVANASGYLRENQGLLIASQSDIEFLRNLLFPSVVERALKLLRFLAKQSPKIGGSLYFHQCVVTISYRLLSVTWSIDRKEVDYLYQDVLQHTLNYISHDKITPAGWLALDAGEKQRDESLAFVAMCFADDLRPLYVDAIYPAVTDAGYKCERLDMEEHTDPIDDKMIADIRRARFLVADLTRQRQNVYFEAGFALGLGKPVIWLLNETEKDKKSFDVRQNNFIYWCDSDFALLKQKLTNRILGSSGLGQGPLRPTG